mmetsp:Transcript_13104/g.38216  ORF Transcript_13104/g.38216 Transcript_13104/m.38216 type:complete len:136 (-) Transcript_13104:2-409(-)
MTVVVDVAVIEDVVMAVVVVAVVVEVVVLVVVRDVVDVAVAEVVVPAGPRVPGSALRHPSQTQRLISCKGAWASACRRRPPSAVQRTEPMLIALGAGRQTAITAQLRPGQGMQGPRGRPGPPYGKGRHCLTGGPP